MQEGGGETDGESEKKSKREGDRVCEGTCEWKGSGRKRDRVEIGRAAARGMWETGRISARAKAFEIVETGRRESTGLLQKKKQEWVWRVPRVRQRRANASTSRTGKMCRISPEVASLSRPCPVHTRCLLCTGQ